MKLITKRHKAMVVVSANEESTDLMILTPGEPLHDSDEKVPEPEIILEEEVSFKDSATELSVEVSRVVNQCQIDNTKNKKIALYGTKLGDVVSVSVKYLVE